MNISLGLWDYGTKHGELSGAILIFELFLLAAIQKDIEMARRIEIAREMEMGREVESGGDAGALPKTYRTRI